MLRDASWDRDVEALLVALPRLVAEHCSAAAPERPKVPALTSMSPHFAQLIGYLEEMHGPAQLWRIRDLVRRVAAGETVTLLCSSACTDPARCHRTVLARLLGA